MTTKISLELAVLRQLCKWMPKIFIWTYLIILHLRIYTSFGNAIRSKVFNRPPTILLRTHTSLCNFWSQTHFDIDLRLLCPYALHLNVSFIWRFIAIAWRLVVCHALIEYKLALLISSPPLRNQLSIADKLTFLGLHHERRI